MTTAPATMSAMAEVPAPASVEHFFAIVDAAVAAGMGIQTQALCGVWTFAEFGSDDDKHDRWEPSSAKADDCPACLVIASLDGFQIVEVGR